MQSCHPRKLICATISKESSKENNLQRYWLVRKSEIYKPKKKETAEDKGKALKKAKNLNK